MDDSKEDHSKSEDNIGSNYKEVDEGITEQNVNEIVTEEDGEVEDAKQVHSEENEKQQMDGKTKKRIQQISDIIKKSKLSNLVGFKRVPNERKILIVDRDNWGQKWELFLSYLGISVGLGNLWRFPYLAYENGGGAFLLPYIIILLLSGVPLYFLELSLSQYSGKSCLNIWSCAPIAKGIGIAMFSVTFCVIIYYNVIISYILYYMFASLSFVLPWTTCDFEWGKKTDCRERANAKFDNISSKSSSEIYWEKQVLNSTDRLTDLGGIKWDLFSALAILWIAICVCVINGIRSSKMVVYFIAIYPYVILFIFLICGLVQPGAGTGILYLIIPSWKKLIDSQVWKAAAGQVFFSLSVSLGALMSYGSYNDFQHNLYKDVLLISLMDTFTNILFSFMIFSNLGGMASDLSVDVSKTVASGFGIVFIAYSESLSLFPAPQIWSFLFFLMMFTLGINNEFGLIENLIISLSDEFPKLRPWKTQICKIICMVAFLLGIPCVTRGGKYVITILDEYGVGTALVFIAIFECFAFYWIYGIQNVERAIMYMLNLKVNWYWKITCGYISPFVLIFVFIYSITKPTPLSSDSRYPAWADKIGSFIASLIMLQIPVWAIIAILSQKSKKLREKVQMSFRSTSDWGPNDSRLKETSPSEASSLEN